MVAACPVQPVVPDSNPGFVSKFEEVLVVKLKLLLHGVFLEHRQLLAIIKSYINRANKQKIFENTGFRKLGATF
jgi:hypothetical protein